MACTMNLRELHEKHFDPRKVLEAYFMRDSEFIDDTITEVFSKFFKFTSSGQVKGDSVIVLSIGPFVYDPLPICEYFNEITFACADDKSIQEVQKWCKNEPDAMDFSPIMEMICDLQGSGAKWTEKQQIMQRNIKRVLKYDVMSCNPFSPIIHPQADCLLLTHCVEHFVTDKKSFCEAMENVSSLLKPGGHLIMITKLYETFYTCGDFKMHVFCFDEDIMKDVLTGAGFVIEEDHIYPRQTETLHSIADYKYFVILKARKEHKI
ncbi:nicotinamide N-methyltransferase-like [Lissotriton helveticus]